MIVDNDSMVAKIYAGEGTPVLSALDGTVKTVSFDETLGGSLTVFSSDDIEITYYGLRDICVERGQPVVQRSILGNMQRDYICVKITKAGRPIDPFDFWHQGESRVIENCRFRQNRTSLFDLRSAACSCRSRAR